MHLLSTFVYKSFFFYGASHKSIVLFLHDSMKTIDHAFFKRMRSLDYIANLI